MGVSCSMAKTHKFDPARKIGRVMRHSEIRHEVTRLTGILGRLVLASMVLEATPQNTFKSGTIAPKLWVVREGEMNELPNGQGKRERITFHPAR